MIAGRPARIARELPGAADHHPTHRSAFTLAEIVVVLFLTGILLGLAIPRIGAAADHAAVRAAATEAAAVFLTSRHTAIYRRAPVAVFIDTSAATVAARVDSVLLLRRDLRQGYGVRLTTTRDSMAYDARGLGIGAANLSLIVRRGRFAETLFVSRLGRLRY
ncbi:MAG TPA: prepilin-type N-terminal cleavage/methylation domain-containing protein [Gemmatimonadaceae bacterium]|jgi:type II secretory pathway pseudopilin PulG